HLPLSYSPILHPHHLRSTLFPYTTLFRSYMPVNLSTTASLASVTVSTTFFLIEFHPFLTLFQISFIQYFIVPNIDSQIFLIVFQDRKSTRLNSSHDSISYAVFCLKKKTRR